jgi:predicted AlkP superfamily phosphohydrolase/phosphomutase
LKWMHLMRAAALLAVLVPVSAGVPAMAAEDGPRVVVLGFDGADAKLVERWMDSGDLPNLARLRASGTYSPLLPTNPPQTPVSWSSFATGLNPGRTEIFDFLKRVEGTYLPDFSMVTPTHRDVAFGAKNPLYLGVGGAAGLGLAVFLLTLLLRVRKVRGLVAGLAVAVVLAGPGYLVFERLLPQRTPWAESGRRGSPVWDVLEEQGKTATILRLPVTFPAEETPGGFMISGLGVPDMRGGIGTPTMYTTNTAHNPADNEFAIRVVMLEEDNQVADGHWATDIQGPDNKPFYDYPIKMAGEKHTSRSDRRRAERDMRTTLDARGVPKILTVPLDIATDPAAGTATVTTAGQALELKVGEWSDMVPFQFPVNWLADRLQPVQGAARFFLVSMEPELNLYLAPVNFHPDFHPVPFTYPANWSEKLSERFGLYKTIGWAIDTWTQSAGLVDETLTLEDVAYTEDRYAEMMEELLSESESDLYVQIFTGPDRAAHMLWRLMDDQHPLYDDEAAGEWGGALKGVYQQMDRIVGRALELIPEDTLFMVCSDHGFSSYRRGVNYNTWLVKNGFMTLSVPYYGEAKTLEDLFHGGSFFENVDWSRTKAYAMGLGEIYINLEGREPQGIVKPGSEYEQVREAIVTGLENLVDPETGDNPVYKVYRREEMYSQFNAAIVPDLRPANNLNYRVEWQTALGGFTPEVISDNLKPWSGDHCSLEPSFVKGILFINRRLSLTGPRMVDMAPTMLQGAGATLPQGLDGISLLPADGGF